VAAVATFGAASGTSSRVTFAKGKTIKIGWAGDMSLQLVKPSLGTLDGAKIAVNHWNAFLGIKG
jgi:hypothetical protein